MSLEEFKNIEDLYKAKTFGTIHVESHMKTDYLSQSTYLGIYDWLEKRSCKKLYNSSGFILSDNIQFLIGNKH